MPALTFSFALRLDSYSFPGLQQPPGPFFNRWLPDGRSDSIQLLERDDGTRISVWFDRRARNRGGFLEWDVKGTEFDVSIMERQGKLDAGILRGELVLPSVSEDVLRAIRQKPTRRGDPNSTKIEESRPYIALGKRVVKLLQPYLARFVDTLRLQFGQYWLEELKPWNSQEVNLGAYCYGLHLCWWDEKENEWFRFLPTAPMYISAIKRPPGRGYAEYLTESDWRMMQRTRCQSEVSLEVSLLGSASQLLDGQHFRQAFVEVVSAVEIAITKRLRVEGRPKSYASAVQSFLNKTSLRDQVALVFELAGLEWAKAEKLLSAIHTRNEIVHQGAAVTEEEAKTLRDVMQIVRELIGLEVLKSPALHPGNSLTPPGATITIGTE